MATQAANGISSSYDALLELFECLSSFLKRLDIYINIPPTPLMREIIVKIMAEVLSVLALATKQIKQGRLSKYAIMHITYRSLCALEKFAKKLLGEVEVEAALQRLDRLTQDEAQIAIAQTLNVVHGLVNNTRIMMDGTWDFV